MFEPPGVLGKVAVSQKTVAPPFKGRGRAFGLIPCYDKDQTLIGYTLILEKNNYRVKKLFWFQDILL